MRVALLTGGGDRPYALGLTQSLTAAGVMIDFIGSDFLDYEELRSNRSVTFLNLRGDMSPDAPRIVKVMRVLWYYLRLLRYALKSEAPVFHILWNNKFESIDRTLVMLYYRCLGKKVVLTVHNVNAGQRDGNDSWWNRFTLRSQYRLASHLFVHTRLMKNQLVTDYGVHDSKISVIPFGINETVPCTDLTREAARARLGIPAGDAVLLFFGNIAPYKGLHYLVEALPDVLHAHPRVRLIVAGRPKGEEHYWEGIDARIRDLQLDDCVLRKIEYIADADTEIYFKAADALVLPYTHVFQSGVLVLGYRFGLPVIATDVGSLKDDVRVGETGYVADACSPESLGAAIKTFLASQLYANSESGHCIRRLARDLYSWDTVSRLTTDVYAKLFRQP